MKFLILIIVLSVFLTNCGFKPIYNSNNSNFEVIEIKNAGHWLHRDNMSDVLRHLHANI